MTMTTPHRASPFTEELLSRMRVLLVDAIEANQRQAEGVPPGPETDAHRMARSSLEEALGRLDSGCYGACTTCGAALPVERLELVPDAELCMACIQRPHSLFG